MIALFLVLFFLSVPGHGSTCWDLTKQQINQPLGTSIELPATKNEIFKEGRHEAKNLDWGVARARLKLSPYGVLTWLKDHTQWKDMSKTELNPKILPNPHYHEFHELDVILTPIVFYSIQWVEQWAYRLLKGTPKNPKQFLVLYQKTKGSSHLSHLCGTIAVKELGKGSDILFYQEANASYYSTENIHTLHVANIQMLRDYKVPEASRP